MAKKVLTDAFVSIDSNDISEFVRSVTLNYNADEVEETTMGDDTHAFLGGLKNWSMDIEAANDMAASQIDSILFPLVGTQVPVAIRATTDAVGTGNPSYGGTGMIAQYSPFPGNSVGDLHTGSVRVVSAGTLARSTS